MNVSFSYIRLNVLQTLDEMNAACRFFVSYIRLQISTSGSSSTTAAGGGPTAGDGGGMCSNGGGTSRRCMRKGGGATADAAEEEKCDWGRPPKPNLGCSKKRGQTQKKTWPIFEIPRYNKIKNSKIFSETIAFRFSRL